MKAKERLYREILVGVLDKRKSFTQLELSKICEVSLGLVNKTIKELKDIGAVDIGLRQFRVIDPAKLLFNWATKRNIKKDISASYSINLPITELEKELPFILTAYSGWRLLSNSVPFDYNEIYCYVPAKDNRLLDLWLKDKKLSRGKENIFIIYTDDSHLIKNCPKKIAPLPQIFVDIYSLAGLASKYFISDILEKYPLFKIEV